jgi:hypothetical protein
MSIKPETLAWLRQTAKFEGGVTAQAILHLLERVETLEAKDQLDVEAWASMRRASCDYQRRLSNLEAAQQPSQDKLDRLIEQDREADDEPQTLHTIALRMVDTLERLGVIPEIRDTLRRAIREPMEQPTPEAAPVVTDAEQPLPPHIAITYQPKSFQPLRMAQPTSEVTPVATDAELADCYSDAHDKLFAGKYRDKALTPADAFKVQIRAIYNLGRQHGAAQPAPSTEFAADKVIVHCPETCWIEIRRIADGQVLHDNFRKGSLVLSVDEPPAPTPAPAGGLVERVAEKMGPQSQAAMDAGELPYGAARAAIREVAEWLDRYGCHGCSLWLREEVARG